MPSVVFSEAFLTIAAILIAVMLTGVIISNIEQLGNIQTIVTNKIKEDMKIRVKIVFVSVNGSTVYIWIKNTGLEPIPASLISSGDLYFGPYGNVTYIKYNSGSYPNWRYILINDVDHDGYWDPSETIEIVIDYGSQLSPGDYQVRYVVYNGYHTDYYFSI